VKIFGCDFRTILISCAVLAEARFERRNDVVLAVHIGYTFPGAANEVPILPEKPPKITSLIASIIK